MKPVIINNQLNKNNIWNGCILASIAHAIMVAQYPELSYEHSWDGENYNIVKIVQGGGYLLERQLMESDSAFESWRDYYEMTSEQVELLKSIYDRKVNNPDENIMLTKREIEIVGAESPEGLSESMASFEEIGVYWNK
jgi:hypothetical protein